jgi:hypothetical protein
MSSLPNSGLRGSDHVRPVGAARDITAHEERLCAGGRDLARDPLARRGGDVVDDHARAFLRETLGDSGAEARARAGDDCNLVLEPHNASLC